MIASNQIAPGMTIQVDKKIYRVESAAKVTVTKAPFVKTKLRDLITDEIIEKNFKVNQDVQEVTLEDHMIEYLYPEGDGFLFIDVDTLEQILVPSSILGNKINYLKEGIPVRALFYGKTVFSVELPQFLELMIIKIEQPGEDGVAVSQTTKRAVLETGAKVDVPLFIEVGDVIKVDTISNEYIQRV